MKCGMSHHYHEKCVRIGKLLLTIWRDLVHRGLQKTKIILLELYCNLRLSSQNQNHNEKIVIL